MIPRLIHQVWVGGPMPQQYRAYSRTWQRLHPGWRMHLWTDDTMLTLRHQHLYDQAEQLAVAGMAGQLRADIARYELLHRYGGMYVDADFEALRCVEPLLQGLDCVAAWEVQDHWIANGFMASRPGHPFIGALIDELPASVSLNAGKRPARSTGTQYLTAMHRKHPGHLTVLPTKYFYPYLYSDIGRPRSKPPWPDECHAVHHWNNRRRQLGIAP